MQPCPPAPAARGGRLSTLLRRREIAAAAVLVVVVVLSMHLAAIRGSSIKTLLGRSRRLHVARPSPGPAAASGSKKAAPSGGTRARASANRTGGSARSSSTTTTRAASGQSSGSMATQTYKYRDPIVFNARDKHTGTVIMLHGLGDSGEGWAPVGMEWAPALRHVKFIFPNAPDRPITVNFGMRMPGWYDIASLDDINQHEDKAGLLESKRYIEQLIEAEAAAGIPSERVVVAGFSQGGAVALMALRSQHKLAGVVGLSTYLPLRKEPPLVSDANLKTPIFQAHGDADYTVQYKYGVETYNLLKELGCDITFKTYNGMAHGAVPSEIADVGSFLQKVLPSK